MQPGDSLIFTGLPEAFFTYLKVAFLTGLMLAAPVIIYEFWIFVAPGLFFRQFFGRLFGHPSFEKLWMVKYIDKRSTKAPSF